MQTKAALGVAVTSLDDEMTVCHEISLSWDMHAMRCVPWNVCGQLKCVCHEVCPPVLLVTGGLSTVVVRYVGPLFCCHLPGSSALLIRCVDDGFRSWVLKHELSNGSLVLLLRLLQTVYVIVAGKAWGCWWVLSDAIEETAWSISLSLFAPEIWAWCLSAHP